MKAISMSSWAFLMRERVVFATKLYLIGCFFLSVPAQAYVDPGSGSVIVTTILGLIAAIGYTFRKYFYKLRRFVTGKKLEDVDEKKQ